MSAEFSVAIMDTQDPEVELAFDYAIEMANNDLLAPHDATLLQATTLRSVTGNDHQMSKNVCRALKVQTALRPTGSPDRRDESAFE